MKINKKDRKKAQAWGIDLVMALSIFAVGLVFFYFYTLNQPNEAEEAIEGLFYDGEIVASSILSEGHPTDWNTNNVITIGILTDNKINNTKLLYFYSLANTQYEKTQNLFNTNYEYYFFLDENMTTISQEVEGIGRKPVGEENLVKITRFTVYKDQPVTAYIYMWN